MTDRILNLDTAQAALAEHRDTFDRLSHLLIEQNKTLNLTRFDTPEEVVVRHFLDSLAALPVLDAAAAQKSAFLMLDVGSGAGFPGLAIAAARPRWEVVSLEATEKKARFQQRLCDALGLDNVQVVSARAETAAHRPDLRQAFDAVTARAVGALAILAELTLGFVRPGGLGLYWKGTQTDDELAAAAAAITAMGGQLSATHRYTLPSADGLTLRLIAVEKMRPTPAAYPRQSFGAIKQRPLMATNNAQRPR